VVRPRIDNRPVLVKLAALLVAVSVSMVAGCTPPPPGTDGALTDGWATFGEPAVFTPQPDTCHRADDASGSVRRYQPVDCDRLHATETVHVGTFTGADAQLTIVPTKTSPARAAARTECETQAAAFLGQQLQDGLLKLRVVMPPQQAWNAGARWFRCDLTEITTVFGGKVAPRTGSLRGALAGTSPLALSCHEPEWDRNDYLAAIEPVDCSQPHRSEFVGAYTESDGFDHDDFNVEDDAVHEKCLRMVASYAALPVDDFLSWRVGTLYFEPSRQEWAEGDRWVRCFLYLPEDVPALTRSAKDSGPDLLPVR
jgi:hypothetical protein